MSIQNLDHEHTGEKCFNLDSFFLRFSIQEY
jgi:hypothetical protein